MNIVKYIDKKIWWIIPTNGHFGYLEDGQQVTSMHNFETFLDREEWLERLEELGIEPTES